MFTSKHRRGKFTTVIFIAMVIQSIWIPHIARAESVRAYDAPASDKAAFLYNSALYTQWPALLAKEFRICVLGNAPVLAALEPLKTKQIKDRPVNISNIFSAREALSCHVLFVGNSAHGSLSTLAKKIGNAPILVISEEDGYDPKNVIITLVAEQGRITFKINRTAAEANSLIISSKLLKLALQIY